MKDEGRWWDATFAYKSMSGSARRMLEAEEGAEESHADGAAEPRVTKQPKGVALVRMGSGDGMEWKGKRSADFARVDHRTLGGRPYLVPYPQTV